MSARWPVGKPRGLVAVALILLGGTGLTLGARRDTATNGCVSDTPVFAYTAAAKKLRQTDVVTFRAGATTRVTTDQLSQNPSFSPDGSRVVFSSGRDGEFDAEVGYDRLALFIASSSGGAEQRLTKGIYDDQPDWSPDGSKVVFVRKQFSAGQNPPSHFPKREELWTVDVETMQEDLLLRAPSRGGEPYAFHSPVWSPDGSQIAFSRAGPGAHGLWVIDADGSNVRRIIADTGGSYFDSPGLAWSPNGEELAFYGGTQHGAGVVVMDLEDGRRHLFASGGSWPAWSPDGSQIAYFEFQPPDNGYQLTLQNTRGGDETSVAGARGPGFEPELDWACIRAGEAPSALPTPEQTPLRCDGTFEVLHRSIKRGDLLRVDFTPTGQGWAVGGGGLRVVSFDDDAYEVFADVPPAGGGDYLNDVSALSSNDVFVAGGQKSRRWEAVVLRWDGEKWTRMETPQIPGAILKGIVAVAPDDVWAVGFRLGARVHSLVLHFDGTKWARVDVPTSAEAGALLAVKASSAENVWAIGERGTGADRALILRYNGSRWTEVDLPERISNRPVRLSAVEVVARNNVWIVGNGGGSSHSYLPPLALRFDGLAWESDPIPGSGRSATLADIEAVGPRNVWAVGFVGSNGLEATARPLVLNWRGSWRRAEIEDPHVGGEFTTVAADDRGDVWAAGEKAGSQWVIQRACRR